MKRQKYGYIYRTHLFGSPTVRVTGAENVRHILLGEHRLVSAQWPASVRTILGSDTLSNMHGSQHRTKKKVSVWKSSCRLRNTSLLFLRNSILMTSITSISFLHLNLCKLLSGETMRLPSIEALGFKKNMVFN